MMNVVVDTNVLISSHLSPKGCPAQIMGLISRRELQLFYSAKILAEYKRVLAYSHLNISVQTQRKSLENINRLGILIEPFVSTIPLPDETDRTFYDTARASGAILITGNTKHFPAEPFIMTPADFFGIAKI